jgi:endonuclease III
VFALTKFFQTELIETETDLHNWLLHEENIPRLKQVRGVGDKTADYLKILVGINTSAVDRHMYAFLANAGLTIKTYQEAKTILNATADQLGVPRAYFDYSVWKYMSSKSQRF